MEKQSRNGGSVLTREAQLAEAKALCIACPSSASSGTQIAARDKRGALQSQTFGPESPTLEGCRFNLRLLGTPHRKADMLGNCSATLNWLSSAGTATLNRSSVRLVVLGCHSLDRGLRLATARSARSESSAFLSATVSSHQRWESGVLGLVVLISL
ncbi:cytidine deaminase [Striga asiatica]|uniref:Cytidine deaminase n=1 Tax=Striga asiatica TaxID=4170 RepID=A0A5A7QB64_STRAF|nr:cytidine deaminase [Striga asiatica]